MWPPLSSCSADQTWRAEVHNAQDHAPCSVGAGVCPGHCRLPSTSGLTPGSAHRYLCAEQRWKKVKALLLNKLPICHLGGTQQQESTDLNCDTNELSTRENRARDAESWLGGGGSRGGRAGGCKLLNREWINTGVLRCSMGGGLYSTPWDKSLWKRMLC